jgi:ABC-type multidrug transport system fused ATPase/permease subunit
MNFFQIFKFAYLILTKYGKLRIAISTLIQIFLSLLDGIAILALYWVITNYGKLDEIKNSWFQSVYIRFIKFGYTEQNITMYFIIFALSLFLIKTLLSAMMAKVILNLLVEEQIKLAKLTLKNIFNMTFGYLQRRNSNEYLHIFNQSISQFVTIMIGNVSNIISELALLIIISSILIINSWEMTLILLIIFVVSSLVLSKTLKNYIKKMGTIRASSSIDLNRKLIQLFNNYKEIIYSQSIDYFSKDIANDWKVNFKTKSNQIFVQSIPKYYFELIFIISLVSIGSLIYLSYGQEVAVQSLTLFFVASFRIMPSILRINNLVLGTKSGIADNNHLIQILKEVNQHKEISVNQSSNNLLVDYGPIPVDMKNVSIVKNGISLLSNVNLKIHHGEKVAIIGESGSGKTSLIETILGISESESGQIKLFGELPNIISLQKSHRISFVSQTPFVTNGSLVENITIGIPTRLIDIGRVQEIVKVLSLGDLNANLNANEEKKFLTPNVVSGGERQRIALARAMYRDSELMVLDEPTSAIDNLNEKRIIDYIMKLEKSIIMVTHNIDIAKRFNRVVEIDNKNKILKEITLD